MDTRTFDCEFRLRENPKRYKESVRIGCGAGFGGDRPIAALKLVERVPDMGYLVLECLAERTLAIRYDAMIQGGLGYDPRISEWMRVLLPATTRNGTCIVTNMGANDVFGAQEEVLKVAESLSLPITVAVAYEFFETSTGSIDDMLNPKHASKGRSTYLGAAPIVNILEESKPDVVITSRVADAALFLGPMVYELGWNWDDFENLAQGSVIGHLLECGCQLTGGYYMHPADKHRQLSIQNLLDISLPFADVSFDGSASVSKAPNSGGEISFLTCSQQLLYEVGDPSAYITPDVIVDFCNVSFLPVSKDTVIVKGASPNVDNIPEKLLQLIPEECGWKGWGEISYGGGGCVERASAADYLVRSWMEEEMPGAEANIVSYIIGLDSLWSAPSNNKAHLTLSHKPMDVRLRVDGLFSLKGDAFHFTRLFEALYTNGPASGGGISTGHKKELLLTKSLVPRKSVYWRFSVTSAEKLVTPVELANSLGSKDMNRMTSNNIVRAGECHEISDQPKDHPGLFQDNPTHPAIGGKRIPLYEIAHSRVGDKGNDMNFSLIPHFHSDIERLKVVITREWVYNVVKALDFPRKVNTHQLAQEHQTIDVSKLVSKNYESDNSDGQVQVEIYEVRGINSLNIVVRNILDGGVNCSRRIDRHGKTIADLILSQEVSLP